MNIEEEYIFLAKLFGACLDMVQGKGGNISIKENDLLLIKQSGFEMSNTSFKKGYVSCSIEAIHKLLKENKESLETSVQEGKGNPSMETFFHLLPPKYIVHLHPTSMMNLLCQETLQQLFFLYPQALLISYEQPGVQLYRSIYSMYRGESIIFLQNHGVIFLENTIESLLQLIVRTFQKVESFYPHKRISDIEYMQTLYKKNMSYYWKPSFLIPSRNKPAIGSFTPDIYLFLQKYSNDFIQVHNGVFFIGGISKESAEILEQMVASYFLCEFDSLSIEIPKESLQKLDCNPQEQKRLASFKLLE